MNIDKLQKTIEKHPVVIMLKEVLKDCTFGHIALTGGAIIDIIDGRKPKDYDIVVGEHKADVFKKAGFKFHHDSSTAITLKRGSVVVQLLKNNITHFCFKIEQARYVFVENKLYMDEDSFDNRLLIPVSYDERKAKNALFRIPLWRRKGFEIPDITYLSLLNVATKIKNAKS